MVIERNACLAAAVFTARWVAACSTSPREPAERPAATPPAAAVGITTTAFGKLGDRPVELYTLTNRNGLVAKITTYGPIVTEMHVPDRTGRLADVVAGFE